MTGNIPGNPASTGETWVLGSAPKSVAAPENNLAFEITWAWTSSPITVSHGPVRPSLIERLPLGHPHPPSPAAWPPPSPALRERGSTSHGNAEPLSRSAGEGGAQPAGLGGGGLIASSAASRNQGR